MCRRTARPPTTAAFPFLKPYGRLALAVKSLSQGSQIPKEMRLEDKIHQASGNHGIILDYSTQMKKKDYFMFRKTIKYQHTPFLDFLI